MDKVKIIGAGLAGCEAALYLSKKGIETILYDAKPKSMSDAHNNGNFAELVCSNSLKSNDINTAGGLLKEELRILNSSIISVADEVRVPAGNALAVDREKFALVITDKIKSDKNIEVVCETVEDFSADDYTIIAAGPLVLGGLNETLSDRLGVLHFYDAAAPIISGDSIDLGATFSASRYSKGEDDYINCPLTKDEYYNFVDELIAAQVVTLKHFEKKEIFEGCMPIEVMAKRGRDTLRFGPLRPVGFVDPLTQKRPFAVIQLRKENALGDMYNIVGFQTNLKFAEQKRVFSLIPALRNAEFLKYGVMHRNSYINAPEVMTEFFSLKNSPKNFIAGQLSGVEGYVESIGSGLFAAINVERSISGKELFPLPDTTIMGALCSYLKAENKNFQPMNANFGILSPLDKVIRDKNVKKAAYAERSVKDMREYFNRIFN